MKPSIHKYNRYIVLCFILVFLSSIPGKSFSQKHLEELIQTKWVLVKMKIIPHTLNDSQIIWFDSSQVNLTMDFKKEKVFISSKRRPLSSKFYYSLEKENEEYKWKINGENYEITPIDSYSLDIFINRKLRSFHFENLSYSRLILREYLYNPTIGQSLRIDYFLENSNSDSSLFKERQISGKWSYLVTDTLNLLCKDTLFLFKSLQFNVNSEQILSFHYRETGENKFSTSSLPYIFGDYTNQNHTQGSWYINELQNEFIFYTNNPNSITKYKITEFSGDKMVLVKVK